MLCDAANGSPLAILDSASITTLRTAAATAVAAKLLARPDSSTATVCGCGVRGRAQLRALARVLPITRAFAFDGNFQRAEKFAGEFSSKGGEGGQLAVRAAGSLREALAESDVVVTCTPSQKSLLFPSLVRPGTFVAAAAAAFEAAERAGSGLGVDLLA